MEDAKTLKLIILKIAALSGGVILVSIVKELCGTEGRFSWIRADFRKKQMAKIVFGKQRVFIILHNGLKEIVEQLTPKDLFTYRKLTYRKDQNERRAMVSQTIYNIIMAGIKVFPEEKPLLYEKGQIQGMMNQSEYVYYSPIEVKENNDHELRRSRMHGLIVGNNKLLLIYNAYQNIKFNKKNEMTMVNFLKNKFRIKNDAEVIRIVYSNGFDMVQQSLKNEELIEDKNRIDLITTDLHMTYVIPNGKDGKLYLQLLLNENLLEEIIKLVKASYKYKIYNAIPMMLGTAKAISIEKGEAVVLCMEEQVPLIETLTDNMSISICTLKREKVEAFLKKRGVT